MKQYIGFSNDHSGSMGGLASAAARDYNTNIAAIQAASLQNNLDTIVNVVQCGIRTKTSQAAVVRQIVNSNVTSLKPITSYDTSGGATPLLDSVGELIDLLKAVPDANDPDVSFLVFVTTDGGENSSKKWTGDKLGNEIKRLQATDRWTFVFRVPRGGSNYLLRFGIPAGNIQEWDQTIRGVEKSTVETTNAFNDYYQDRAKGVKSSSTFYASTANVSAQQVKASLKDISGEVSLWNVASHEDGSEIRPFVEDRLGSQMLKGAAFYQLTKTESKVQDTKVILIRDRKTNCVYFGDAARQLIGLPTVGNARVVPGGHGDFEIYIQSTSVNRKLVGGSLVLYWSRIGKAFTEGPSYMPAPSAAMARATSPVAPVVVATPVAKTPSTQPAPIIGGKFNLRRKNGVVVKEVDTYEEAVAEVAKAKRQKKAALSIERP
jgi:hypothetical protein